VSETIPTEQPPLVGEVSANSCGSRVSRDQRNGSPRSYSRISRPEPLLFLPSRSSIVLTRLSGPRSRSTTSQKSGSAGNRTRGLWVYSQEIRPLDHRGGQCNGIQPTLFRNPDVTSLQLCTPPPPKAVGGWWKLDTLISGGCVNLIKFMED
jgi:hypothetical protein